MHRFAARQRGVTMVEALVALVVLSVGLLGIAGLYVASLRANRTAQTRTTAVNLVSDMEDRIRANSRARDSYRLATYGGAPAQHSCTGQSSATQNCTAAFLAEEDLARWVTSVTAAFGAQYVASDVQVTTAGTGFPDTYTISVTWREAGEASNFDYTSVLRLIAVSP